MVTLVKKVAFQLQFWCILPYFGVQSCQSQLSGVAQSKKGPLPHLPQGHKEADLWILRLSHNYFSFLVLSSFVRVAKILNMTVLLHVRYIYKNLKIL